MHLFLSLHYLIPSKDYFNVVLFSGAEMTSCGANEPRKWRCASKNGDIQVWERVNLGSECKQRQFRFGQMGKTRITTVIATEKDIEEDKYEGNDL
jgi:hypothetical protein